MLNSFYQLFYILVLVPYSLITCPSQTEISHKIPNAATFSQNPNHIASSQNSSENFQFPQSNFLAPSHRAKLPYFTTSTKTSLSNLHTPWHGAKLPYQSSLLHFTVSSFTSITASQNSKLHASNPTIPAPCVNRKNASSKWRSQPSLCLEALMQPSWR